MMQRFTSSTSNAILFSATEIEELDADPTAMDDKIFIAVRKEFQENKNNLMWAIQNFRTRTIVLLHMHHPDMYISMMGGKYPVSQLSPVQVKAHRMKEQQKIHEKLDQYVLCCNSLKVRAEKLVIDTDDIAKGLIDAINQHRIARLVMGAAGDRQYSANMKSPKSKKASIVAKEAPLYCTIWFVCKGNFICTRESSQQQDARGQPPSISPSNSSISSKSEQLRPKSMPQTDRLTNPVQELIKGIFRSKKGMSMSSSTNSRHSSSNSLMSEGIPRNNLVESYPPSTVGGDDITSITDSDLMMKDDASVVSDLVRIGSRDGSTMPNSLPHHSVEDIPMHGYDQQDHLEVDDDMYNKLRQAFTEVELLKHHAYEESCKRSTAEREAMEASQRVKILELKNSQRIKEVEELKESIKKLGMEVESLMTERNKICDELNRAIELKSQLEMLVDSYSSSIKDLEENLSSTQQLLSSIQREKDTLCLERDNAVNIAKELREKIESISNAQPLHDFLEFSFPELEEATQRFNEKLKIGEGGYGCVYKGFLCHRAVAIKVIRPHNWQGASEFQQEVEILSKIRHRNLVKLIGTCPEKRALVYEYLPNGSLEDHLTGINNALPLSWQARIRIAAEICSALIFLHSKKPQSVIHGDLKPANILLDANFTSKLSDFGISRLLTESATSNTTLYHQTGPKGTLVYMDPEFLMTGELTTQSDVYSFGIMLLRLVTGKPPFGIVREVREALAKEKLQDILDSTAGAWPLFQAQKLTELGIRCCEISRKLRPDLVRDIRRIIAPMAKPQLQGALSVSIEPNGEDDSLVPQHFICPILKEIMTDPHIASDGYTYEAEAIRGWMRNRQTSPMTNLEFPNEKLIPNLALRSAIKKWLQRHGRI